MVTRLELAPDLVIWQGDVREVLPQLPSESVQCVVTSPPYFGLRDYGVAGQIGLEPTPEEYVQALVDVFREVHRVLRKDGVVWLNLGDTYHGAGRAEEQSIYEERGAALPRYGLSHGTRRRLGEVKRKDLLGIPWRVAFALQADGWYLRADVIWAKPNPLPESVTDRPTRSHEYLFLLAKSERYYYDSYAVMEPATSPPLRRTVDQSGSRSSTDWSQAANGQPPHQGLHRVGETGMVGRNRRSVWWIPTQPTPWAHFAVMPEALAEPCILAGTSPMACPWCGAPWERVVERIPGDTEAYERPKKTRGMDSAKSTLSLSGNGSKEWAERGTKFVHKGWRPTCSCEGNDGSGRCIVLDPFWGAGTTGLVALQHGRIAWGIELNQAYVEISKRRLLGTQTTLLGRM